MADLKAIYAAVDEQAALNALDTFGEHWNKKYPKISQSWRANWANLSTYFKYPQEVCRLIYTTNAIEGFNRQLRKVTKAKSVFPTDDSLLKMLYLAMMDITKKMDWTAAGLEPDSRPDGNLLCRTHARITPLWPDVKGKMNGSATLDIHPHRRYVVVKTAAGFTACRPESILFYFHHRWSLHRIWD